MMTCADHATWPVSSTYALPASPASAHLARQLTRGALSGRPDPLVDVAELLVSELVANAVRHATSAPIVRIEADGDSVWVAVQDASAKAPDVQHTGVDADGGRGLLLVDSLATSWGWSKMPGGKRVWFTL
jgi:anti-sigma regulatory factor (Ser/Thr protein kinase)